MVTARAGKRQRHPWGWRCEVRRKGRRSLVDLDAVLARGDELLLLLLVLGHHAGDTAGLGAGADLAVVLLFLALVLEVVDDVLAAFLDLDNGAARLRLAQVALAAGEGALERDFLLLFLLLVGGAGRQDQHADDGQPEAEPQGRLVHRSTSLVSRPLGRPGRQAGPHPPSAPSRA